MHGNERVSDTRPERSAELAVTLMSFTRHYCFQSYFKISLVEHFLRLLMLKFRISANFSHLLGKNMRNLC